MHGVGVFNQYLIRFQFGGFPFAHKLSEAEQPGLKIAHFYLPVLIFDALDNALLDIVFGKFKPVGKLTFEIPSSMDAVKKQLEDLPFDSENPAFKFGDGLSYSD